MNIHKIAIVAAREYLETVKSKMFLLSITITPMLIVVMLVLVGRASLETITRATQPRAVAVIDLSDKLYDGLQSQFSEFNAKHTDARIDIERIDATPQTLDADVRHITARIKKLGDVDALIVLPADVLDRGNAKCYTNLRKLGDMAFMNTLDYQINAATVAARCRIHNISPDLVARIQSPVHIESIDVGDPNMNLEQNLPSFYLVPFFFLFLMFMGVFGMNQQMLTSVIEEKSSRVIEVLLSSMRPFELMAGKIIGLSFVGFTMICVWGFTGLLAAKYRGIEGLITSDMLGWFLVYYVLGFILISSILAAIGSVCNTTKEAQSLMTPLSLLLVMPLVGWFFIARDPDSTLAIVLSFIPPLTPMIMVLRIAANPHINPAHIFATVTLLLVSIPAAIWAGAKIFHIGILLYGKPPKLTDLIQWLRDR